LGREGGVQEERQKGEEPSSGAQAYQAPHIF